MADGFPGGEAPVIRIVKKKKGHGGHHGGAWKVAYADFVTAMMAFFLVMWIVGLSKPVRQAIAAYFNDPAGFTKKGGAGTPLGEGEMQNLGGPAPILPKGGYNMAEIQAQFKEAARTIKRQLERMPEFQNLKENIEINLTSEGLRIELLEKTSSLFFDSGKANLKPQTIKLLRLVSGELRKLKNPIIIEGHTDSQPLNGPNGYSNWELSTERANSARRAMMANGLRPGQVMAVRGYADQKLKKPDDPFHFTNRRVSILVAYTGNE
jgi:chemotaxis protein MotB